MSVRRNLARGQCVIARAMGMGVHSVSVRNGVIMAIHSVRVGQVDTLCAAGFLNGRKIRVTCIHTEGNPAASLSLPCSSKY